MIQKTYSMKGAEIEKKWYVVDADDQILGRLATKVASVLRGKTKPTFTPHLDMGDNVIIINAEKIKLTGLKTEQKEYFSHSQYPGGIKMTNIRKYMEEKPEFIVEHAVKGMLPKGKLGRAVFKNLKVYKGSEHPHAAQKPEKLEL
jgi:large subunit ribosomal protein L13